MSNNIPFIDQIAIRKPCNADWDSMVGNDEVRFCEHCAKSVHDLSSMTRARAEKLVMESNGALCLRYRRLSDGGLKTIDPARPLYNLTRKVSKIAAGAFAMALTVSSTAIARSTSNADATISSIEKERKPSQKDDSAAADRMLAGRVYREQGSEVSSASLTLTGKSTGNVYTTTSGAFGAFLIEGLPPESYVLSIKAPNHKTLIISEVDISKDPVTKVEAMMRQGDPNEDTVLPVPEYQFVMGIGEVSVSFTERVIDYEAIKAFESGDRYASQLDELTMMLALTNAIGANRLDNVKSLLAAKVRVNRFDYEEARTDISRQRVTPALMSITKETGTEIIDELVKAGANMDKIHSDGRSPVMVAIDVNNIGALKELIKLGAKLKPNYYGATPLMYAAARDNLGALDVLLDAGQDVNAKDKNGRSALVDVLTSDSQRSANTRDIIKRLKQHGATL